SIREISTFAETTLFCGKVGRPSDTDDQRRNRGNDQLLFRSLVGTPRTSPLCRTPPRLCPARPQRPAHDTFTRICGLNARRFSSPYGRSSDLQGLSAGISCSICDNRYDAERRLNEEK